MKSIFSLYEPGNSSIRESQKLGPLPPLIDPSIYKIKINKNETFTTLCFLKQKQ